MIDVNLIRRNPEAVKAGVAKKHVDSKLVDKFLNVDKEWRAKTAALDQLKAESNMLAKEAAVRKAEHTLSKAQLVKKRIAEVSEECGALEAKRSDLLGRLPNLPFDDVPVGSDASGNRVLREVGAKPSFSFEPQSYLPIAERLGLIDVKKAAEVTGSRFGYLLRDAALLEFGLIRLAFDVLLPHRFIPVVPPDMIRPKVFAGMGRLSGGQEEERYYLAKDDLYLTGSAEHTLGPLHIGDVFKATDLPRRYAGFSTCFRREAGSYGRDTKGILRVHQFDKVEMFSFTAPDDSETEHQFLLARQEELMQRLELPYRVVELCTGDMGWTDARQYDLETWFPGQGEYRETHSCSNTTDYQARGVNVRYQEKGGEKGYVHMLNATAFAIGRTLIAIIENYQTKKGTVKVPDLLRPYVGKAEIKS